MSVIKSGNGILLRARNNVTGNDAAGPPSTVIATILTNSVEVPPEAKGAITHCIVDIDGSASTFACAVHVWGLFGDAAIINTSSGFIWAFLGTLNNGRTIALANLPSVIQSVSDFTYAETLLNISAYSRLAVTIDNTANIGDNGIDVFFLFER